MNGSDKLNKIRQNKSNSEMILSILKFSGFLYLRHLPKLFVIAFLLAIFWEAIDVFLLSPLMPENLHRVEHYSDLRFLVLNICAAAIQFTSYLLVVIIAVNAFAGNWKKSIATGIKSRLFQFIRLGALLSILPISFNIFMAWTVTNIGDVDMTTAGELTPESEAFIDNYLQSLSILPLKETFLVLLLVILIISLLTSLTPHLIIAEDRSLGSALIQSYRKTKAKMLSLCGLYISFAILNYSLMLLVLLILIASVEWVHAQQYITKEQMDILLGNSVENVTDSPVVQWMKASMILLRSILFILIPWTIVSYTSYLHLSPETLTEY